MSPFHHNMCLRVGLGRDFWPGNGFLSDNREYWGILLFLLSHCCCGAGCPNSSLLCCSFSFPLPSSLFLLLPTQSLCCETVERQASAQHFSIDSAGSSLKPLRQELCVLCGNFYYTVFFSFHSVPFYYLSLFLELQLLISRPNSNPLGFFFPTFFKNNLLF